MTLAASAVGLPMFRGGWLFSAANEAEDGTGPSEDPDSGLVVAALDGDDGAFAELVRRHKGRIFSMATRFARDAHEREDLCQEIFVQAYRKLRKFRGESPFGHWLGRLAVRKCYDLLRQSGRERRTHAPLLDDEILSVADPTTDHEQAAREAREILARAMAALPPDDRLVLTLLELEDLPVREAASLTGWSETNVRTRACRARLALRKTLDAQGAKFP